MMEMFSQLLNSIITLQLKPDHLISGFLEDFFLVQLTRVGTCVAVLTIMGEMMLASRRPSGLAEEGKEKCN